MGKFSEIIENKLKEYISNSRENIEMNENSPRDPLCDPLISLSEFGNGNIV